ncbi:hypothetical protein MIMGU_mgv11b014693mg [Erythranthe guttata]|uniref:Uncharacterized protein n=1 Tax=Erythranthe guttata TaxID=4155 RepID=A0A022R3T3_ERYGU|nr:hypothetical protein MIMGU_mgv11b014693mg [Erythranthe guttata]
MSASGCLLLNAIFLFHGDFPIFGIAYIYTVLIIDFTTSNLLMLDGMTVFALFLRTPVSNYSCSSGVWK